MGTYVNLYAEILSPNTDSWVKEARYFTETGGSGWMPLLGLSPVAMASGEPFPGIGTRGYPTDMDEATIEEMISRLDLERLGSGHHAANDIHFAWFTLADLHDIAASDAEFKTRRLATKANTLARIQSVIDAATERCDTFCFKREFIRFIAAVSP